MSDLVDRLRRVCRYDYDGHKSFNLMQEAADALEAKDAEIERLQSEHGDMNVHCVELEKEIERLTKLDRQNHEDLLDRLHKIERLQSKVLAIFDSLENGNYNSYLESNMLKLAETLNND